MKSDISHDLRVSWNFQVFYKEVSEENKNFKVLSVSKCLLIVNLMAVLSESTKEFISAVSYSGSNQ